MSNVTVAIFDNPINVDIAKDLLTSAKIECMTQGDSYDSLYPGSPGGAGYRLIVGQKDAEEAFKILQEHDLI
jgi:hypothetical protein